MKDYSKLSKETRKMLEILDKSKTVRRIIYLFFAVIVVWAVLYNVADIINAIANWSNNKQ